MPPTPRRTRPVATRTGPPNRRDAAIIDRLEAGTNHADLPLAYLHALADALAVSVTHLFTSDPTPAPAGDVERLGSYLHDTGWAPKSAISELLGWTPARTDQAIDGSPTRSTSPG